MNQLNKEQLAAVQHINKPLLIVAGAGTGKTTVITQKIHWLVAQKLAKANEILALTFTEKAAKEMEERADKIMPYGYIDMWIMTFHGFCEKILRQHGLDLGLPADFKLLNEFGQWALIKKNLDKFHLDYYRPLGNQTKFITALLQHFSRAKDENITPAEYLAYAQDLQEDTDAMLSGQRGKYVKQTHFKIQRHLGSDEAISKEMAAQEIARINEIANAYHVYQNLLLEKNYLDFGDLINYTLKLLKERPIILAILQKQFKYILVDEFQDTNWSQYELIKILSPKGHNLTIVGDDDQSIFRFRGASMSNILQFKKDYKNTSEIILTQNYRNTQNILDLSYNFIQLNNPNRLEAQLQNNEDNKDYSLQQVNKRLLAQTKGQGHIEVLRGQDLLDEVNKVINKIISLKESDTESSWNDFAILVRANASAKDFINSLELHNIPYVFVASRGLYSRPVIMNIIAYLNLLDNYHENTAMYRVLNIDIFKFTHEEIINFLRLAKKKAWSLYETLQYLANFSQESGEKIKILLHLIKKHSQLSKAKKTSEIIYAFLNDSGYLKFLSAQAPAQAKEGMRELNAFLKHAQSFEAETDDASLKSFLTELNLEMESGEEGNLSIDPESGPEMVKVLTVHAAKGLEFKYVFIVNMVDLRFPTIERKDPIALPDALVKEILPVGDIHLEEERRLFYVAMTRAKQGLYFSWALDYGGVRLKKPSRFLIELGLEDKKDNHTLVTPKHQNKLSFAKSVKTASHQQTVYDVPKFYSYTQLQSYDKCPHQYFIDHVLKIPKPGKNFFSFGQSMHLTLQRFFATLMQNQTASQLDLFGQTKIANASTDLTLDTLLRIYKESWIGDWYGSKEEKQEYFAKGKKQLKEFFHKHHQKWPTVVGLEQGFKLRIGGHLIYGKIDRIDDLGDAGLQIVDYKTTELKNKAELKINAEQKNQLLLYQLACTDVLKRQAANLQFYFLDNNSEVNFLGDNKDMEKMQAWVIQTIQDIEHSIKTGYFPHKSDPCRYCKKHDEVGQFLSV